MSVGRHLRRCHLGEAGMFRLTSLGPPKDFVRKLECCFLKKIEIFNSSSFCCNGYIINFVIQIAFIDLGGVYVEARYTQVPVLAHLGVI